MARYDKTSKRISKNQVCYATTLHNKVVKRNDDMYFISQEGDRLDLLASRFYGDSSLWWFIAHVNNLKTNNIPAGVSLRIPISTSGI